jgi:hypothetical protein
MMLPKAARRTNAATDGLPHGFSGMLHAKFKIHAITPLLVEGGGLRMVSGDI